MKDTFFITTLGCPKNQADSRQIQQSMMDEGFIPSDTPETALFHIINTCAFILPAKEETIAVTLEAIDLKKSLPGQRLIVAGCFAERYQKEIGEEMPEVDLFFGTGKYSETGRMVSGKFGPSRSRPAVRQNLERTNAVSLPLKISEGCNRSCTFCSIPAIRGPFTNLSGDEIVREARGLAERGVRELNIVSQDTISYYASEGHRLVDLLHELSSLPGIAWIRLLYLYPDRKTYAFLESLRESMPGGLVPYFEIPVQHTAKGVLKRMRRAGDRAFYTELFALARSLHPETEIRTSFLLGFPGESPEDVDDLLEFMSEARPEKLSLFEYSAEEGTEAARMKPAIPSREIVKRMNLVREEHLKLLKEIHTKRIGRTYPCLIDECDDSYFYARRPQDAPEIDEIVYIPYRSGIKTGDIVNVRITGFYEYDMTGQIEP
jgi:ribosomal protein S12 methylthiotransferase